MSKRSAPGGSSAVFEGLDFHLVRFLAALATAGYAEKTQHDKRRLIAPFVRWAQDAPLAVTDLDKESIDTTLAQAPQAWGKQNGPSRETVHD